MRIKDYDEANGRKLDPTVVYAGTLLERYGDQFGVNFGVHNAVDKAAELLCVFLDEDLFDWHETRVRFRDTGDWVEWT